VSIMVVGGGLEPSNGVSCLRPDRVLTMGERERERERERETERYVLPRSHSKCQMYLPKSEVSTCQDGHG